MDAPTTREDGGVSAPAAAEAADATGTQTRGAWVYVDKGMLSRVLYPNPVCLLTTRDAESEWRNVMTITWLTPINNQGGFVCSMNKNRHSAQFVNRVGAFFVLNVPVHGMEELVLSIGGCSGATVDKFEAFDLAVCSPGGAKLEAAADAPNPESGSLKKKQKLSKQELARQAVRGAAAQCLALSDCVAHVLCRVDRVDDDDGHWLLRCSQLAAWCRAAYWDGKTFRPRRSDAPPCLTFLGSKVFGVVHAPVTNGSGE